MSTLNWFGEQVKQKMRDAGIWGVNRTMSDCIFHAKANHMGWLNRTGTAEGSVRVVEFAIQHGKEIVGQWGSQGVNYVIWLELKHGSFLRNAADNHYKKLTGYIKSKFSGIG